MVVETRECFIESYGLTDIGCVRCVNEDAFAMVQEKSFFVVADGIGGHNAGEVAATQAVKHLANAVMRSDPFDSCSAAYNFLQRSIAAANLHVWQQALNNPKWGGMGSTLCCCLFYAQFVIYAHVGDSRVYRYRPGNGLCQLTQDHSPETPSGRSHLLTRAFGRQAFVVPDFGILPIEDGDTFVLCSDGITDLIPNHEMCEEMMNAPHGSIQKVCHKLLRTVIGRGGPDNATILISKVNQSH